MTLRGFQFQPMFQEPAENNSQTVDMVLLRARENYYIIQVDKGIGQVQLTKAILHEPLECRRSITQPVRHPQKLIHSHATHRKGGVLLGLLGHLDLPET